MRSSISTLMVGWVSYRESGSLTSTLAGRFWNVGVNDEMWVTAMVDVGSGL